MPPKRATSSATSDHIKAESKVEDEAASSPRPVADGSALPSEQWAAMQELLNHIYDHRTADGYDPSKVFHRKVNKRAIPAYYEVIKEPMALSTIKQKINTREYKTFPEFVRDFALIPHNAQVYNRPDAGAYQDALIIREQLEERLRKLVDDRVVSPQQAALPDLGEIPPVDDLPEEEEEDEEEDEEEEEDDDEELGEGHTKKRGRGRPRRSSIVKRDTKDDKNDDPEARKKRGRPPKVLTPTEARIQALLKGIRKPKNNSGQLKISHFERLPDKLAMPEYFNEIKNPIAYDVLKRKYKRKKYNSLEQFMKDVDLMFENAKLYNEDESQIYKDAVELQVEAHKLASEEMAKPDTEFAMEEGRMPLPDGILHNGELYKVGDWVLVQNANDLTKPIPSQIYRTYQDSEGGRWVNVCWYYRPEQTVHRFDKHFLENEVVKTGQYRDHRVDEIVGRCFIMFVTRYYKGRPRNLSLDTDVFVCEARYNEEKLTCNKIKTWASCLPDEVRDKDYEMTLFDGPRKMKKFPSPIAYTLKDEQKETDELPKPEWGAENAPPKIGAVHRRPRDPKDSPPPEPTPTPPPQPPPQPVRTVSHMSPPASTNYTTMSQATPSVTPAPMQSPARPPIPARNSYTPAHPQHYSQPTASPGPVTQQRPLSSQQRAPFPPSTPQIPNPTTNTRPPLPHTTSTPQIPPTNPYLRPDADASSYRGPPPIEVYTLPDAANASIPHDIRAQFQQDDQGRVLFFTAPPLLHNKNASSTDDNGDGDPGDTKSRPRLLGHTIRYQAAKARSAADVASRRAEYLVRKRDAQALKRRLVADEEEAKRDEVRALQRKAVRALEMELAKATQGDLRILYGEERWEEMVGRDVERLAEVQRERERVRKEIEERERRRALRERLGMKVGSGMLDD